MNIQKIIESQPETLNIFVKDNQYHIYQPILIKENYHKNDKEIKISDTQIDQLIKKALERRSVKEYIEVDGNYQLNRSGSPGFWNDFSYLLNENKPSTVSISVKNIKLKDKNLCKIVEIAFIYTFDRCFYTYKFEDDTIYTNLYMMLNELNAAEVLYNDKKIERLLNNLGLVSHFIINLEDPLQQLQKFLGVSYQSKEFTPHFMKIENNTNLNIFDSSEDRDINSPGFSLFNTFNCRTNQGKRLLASYLRQPLLDKKEIEKRLNLSEIVNLDLSHFSDLLKFTKKIENKSIKIEEIVKICENFLKIEKLIFDLERSSEEFSENIENKNCENEKNENNHSVIQNNHSVILNNHSVIQNNHSVILNLDFINPLKTVTTSFKPIIKYLAKVIDFQKVKENIYEFREDVNPNLESLMREKRKILIDLDVEYQRVLVINKKIKLETNPDFCFRLARSDFNNFKNFKNFNFVERSVLKNGIYFLNKNLFDLNERMAVWKNEYQREISVIRNEMINCLKEFVPMIEGFNHLIAQLDVYSAFNEKYRNPSYCRPSFVEICSDDSHFAEPSCIEPSFKESSFKEPCFEKSKHKDDEIENSELKQSEKMKKSNSLFYKLVDSFHPLLEFSGCIKNSIEMCDKNICVITGPNMGGKSTFVKQCAIISIMAQIGCYVPAKYCKIPIFDGIYTRIGASDCISRGESTFMREMTDIARICSAATKKSLIIIDELGRGTSARDGLSIAMAVCKYLKKLGISFFTTHFPEICDLDVINKKVIFNEVMLYKLVDGKCDQSYGLNVCRLAGFPEEVIECVEKLMKDYN
ncbi:DNA mismatch repair protein msh2 [Dictyocoela muelleri]|nr:DNA mismatch repair protein msh2 [Dictyocoela muelleri]